MTDNTIKSVIEDWVNKNIKKEFDPIDINDVYAAFEAGAQWQSQQAQGEAVAWQFYQDGKWHTGMNTNNHRKTTEAAGFPVRDLCAHPPAPAAVPENLSKMAELHKRLKPIDRWGLAAVQPEEADMFNELWRLAAPAPAEVANGINRYGLDARYFHQQLGIILRDIDSYTPDGMMRALARLALVARPAEPDKDDQQAALFRARNGAED